MLLMVIIIPTCYSAHTISVGFNTLKFLIIYTIKQDGTMQWRRGPVRVVVIQCLSIEQVYFRRSIFMISEHPHICTDISVGAEIARDGRWISGRRSSRQVTSRQ